MIKLQDASNTLTFYYAADGVISFHIKNNVIDETFYYKKNAQNDIIGIYSTDGTEIAQYEYDAWGNCIAKYLQDDGTYDIIKSDYKYNDISNLNRFIAYKNPFRYRSYYYDFETNLYYLNSRYYDPEIGRFINADDIATLDITQVALNGLNLYAYCLNNPVNDFDSNGQIGFLLALLIGALAFAFANTAVQLVSTVVKGVTTGKWDWSWEKFAGAFIGGLIGGIAFVLSGFNTQIAFGVMSFGETLTTNLFTNITGKTNDSFISIIFKSIVAGGAGFLFGKGFNKLIGVTKGINSFIAVFKSGITKLINNTAAKMAIKVFAKGTFSIFILKNAGITNGFSQSLISWINYLLGNKGAIGYDL